MAGARYSIVREDVALVAATAKDVLVYKAPSTHRTIIRKWWVDFDGVTAGNNHVLVQIFRGTGTPTGGTTITSDAASLDGKTPTAPVGIFYTAPTGGITAGAGTKVESHRWHPTSGTLMEEALGEEIEIAPGELFVIRCTAPQAVNVTAGMRIEE